MLLWLCFVYKQIMFIKVGNFVYIVFQGFEFFQVQVFVFFVEFAVWFKRVRIVRGRIERSCDRVLLNRIKNKNKWQEFSKYFKILIK